MRSNDDAPVKAVATKLPILAVLVIATLIFSACSDATAPSHVLTATQTVALSSTPGSENQESSVENLTRGAKLYAANCQVCHGGGIGGGMLDIPPPNNARGHTWHHADCQLIGIVLNGSDNTAWGMLDDPDAVPRMPAWKGVLTEEEVVAILGHIKTWWTQE